MLVGRRGLSPVMVGRAADLDRLSALLAGGRTPSVAFVGGEAGVGKTRLVQELVGRAPAQVPVLAGQADPGDLGRPLELLLDGVRGVTGVDRQLVAAIEDRGLASEDRILAGLDLVRRVTGPGPALIVFEDLHWADPESITLFERLAEPDCGPLLLIGTYRPDALSRRHPASELLPRLERRHSVVHVRLERMSPADVGDFLAAVYGRMPSYRVIETLHSRTGGNPFFLEELLAAGAGDPEELCSRPLPWTLSEVIRAQLDELAPEERRVAEAAAVLGHKVPFDLLATVTGSSEDELIAVLRTLVQAGLMLETEADVFSFRHALAREAIDTGLLGRERRRLHEAALDALRETKSEDREAIARHAHGAARYDDMVVAARDGAGEYLAHGSTYKALQLAEFGLDEADDDLELLRIATRSAWLAGLVGDATAHCDRWLDVARREGDEISVSAALRLRARLTWEAGDIPGAEAAIDDAVAMLDRVPCDEERGQVLAAAAQLAMLREDWNAAYEWADRALEVAERIGSPQVRLAAMVEKASAMADDPSRSEEGARLLREVADEGERLEEHLVVARALNNLIWHARLSPDPAGARASLERMRAAAVRAGFASGSGAGYAQGAAKLAAFEGDFDAVMAELDEGRRRDRGWIHTARGSSFMILHAGFALEAGDLDLAEQCIRGAGPPDAVTRAALSGLAFHLACRRGDLAAARAALLDVLAAIDARGFAWVFELHDLVAAALRAGLAADEVRPLVERAGDSRGVALPPDDAWRCMLDAQLAEAEGRFDEARAGFEAAVAGWRFNLDSMPYHLATARVGAARSLIALDHLEEARAQAAEAEELLHRWRGWRVDDLHAVQRRLGIGHAVAGADALTPREREVVALLAEGLSNAELATKLYISRKTAAVHVSNILAKLGMSSRAEVAAWAVRESLATVDRPD